MTEKSIISESNIFPKSKCLRIKQRNAVKNGNTVCLRWGQASFVEVIGKSV